LIIDPLVAWGVRERLRDGRGAPLVSVRPIAERGEVEVPLR
jgi:hypothetical protein